MTADVSDAEVFVMSSIKSTSLRRTLTRNNNDIAHCDVAFRVGHCRLSRFSCEWTTGATASYWLLSDLSLNTAVIASLQHRTRCLDATLTGVLLHLDPILRGH